MIRSILHDAVSQRSAMYLSYARPSAITRRCQNTRSRILGEASSSRFLSSSSSTHTPSTSKPSTRSDVVPPVLSKKDSSRKPKVELRPGPVKTKPSTKPTIPPPAKLTQRIALPPASPPPKSAKMGIQETVQHDIQNAEDLGILKPTPEDYDMFRRIIHKTLEITKFYFRGLKLIYTRRKVLASIRARVREGGEPLQRSENRLMRTQRQDVNKVIPFVIIAALLEEIIPILALYAPFMLPSTCLLPAQANRIEEKKTEKTIAAVTTYKSLYSYLQNLEDPAGQLPEKALYEKDASTLLCSVLRLPTFGFSYLRVFRIHQHLKFIGRDDQLLLQGNTLAELNEKELEEALQERGFIARGLSKADKTSLLKSWLNSVKDTPAEDSITRRLSLLVRRQ